MYRCNQCEKRFEEPKEIHTSYEYYYGISEGHRLLILSLCPYCESEDIQELRMVEDDE